MTTYTKLDSNASNNDRYVSILKEAGVPLSRNDICEIYVELYPEIVSVKTTSKGTISVIQQIAAEIGSVLSRVANKDKNILKFKQNKVFHFSYQTEKSEEDTEEETEEDKKLEEKLSRTENEKIGYSKLLVEEQIRYDLFKEIATKLKSTFKIEFDVDHAASIHDIQEKAITPDNLQLLPSRLNRQKSKNSITRLSYDAQVEMITNLFIEICYIDPSMTERKGYFNMLMNNLKYAYGEK